MELFTIVERTNQEVDSRHPMHLRGQQAQEHAPPQPGFPQGKDNTAVLSDLLWTLYSKFEAVAEGHRVVHDIVFNIARRNGLRHPLSLASSFKELWKLYQSEVRRILVHVEDTLINAVAFLVARLHCNRWEFIYEDRPFCTG